MLDYKLKYIHYTSILNEYMYICLCIYRYTVFTVLGIDTKNFNEP